MQNVIGAMAERSGPASVDYDYVLVAGHFLARDENIFTYFEVPALGRVCDPRHNAYSVGLLDHEAKYRPM